MTWLFAIMFPAWLRDNSYDRLASSCERLGIFSGAVAVAPWKRKAESGREPRDDG